jgi:hypothetical protein
VKRVVEGIAFVAFIVGAGAIDSAPYVAPVLLFGGLSIIILLNWKKGGENRGE